MKSIEVCTKESLAAQDAYWHAKAAAGEPENVCSDYQNEPRSSFLKKAHKYAKAAGFEIKGLRLVRDAGQLVKAIRDAAFASGIDAHGGCMLPEVTVAPAPEPEIAFEKDPR